MMNRRPGPMLRGAAHDVNPPRAKSVIDTGEAPKALAVNACPDSMEKNRDEHGGGPRRDLPSRVHAESEHRDEQERPVDGDGDAEEGEPEHGPTIGRTVPPRGPTLNRLCLQPLHGWFQAQTTKTSVRHLVGCACDHTLRWFQAQTMEDRTRRRRPLRTASVSSGSIQRLLAAIIILILFRSPRSRRATRATSAGSAGSPASTDSGASSPKRPSAVTTFASGSIGSIAW